MVRQAVYNWKRHLLECRHHHTRFASHILNLLVSRSSSAPHPSHPLTSSCARLDLVPKLYGGDTWVTFKQGESSSLVSLLSRSSSRSRCWVQVKVLALVSHLRSPQGAQCLLKANSRLPYGRRGTMWGGQIFGEQGRKRGEY